jgi:hypothetical protein
MTAAIPRTGAAMTNNVTFPSPAVAATAKTISAKFPTAGVVTGALLTKIAKIDTTDTFFGDASVVKSAATAFGEAFVGIGTSSVPSGGTASIKLQVFGGDMAPSKVIAAWSGTGNIYARANFTDLTDGASITFGNVTAMDLSGADLSDFAFSADGTGYEYSGMELVDGSNNTVTWRAFMAGGKIASRGLPHLPSTVSLADVAPAFAPTPVVVLFHKATGAAVWDDGNDDWVVSKTGDALDSAGR